MTRRQSSLRTFSAIAALVLSACSGNGGTTAPTTGRSIAGTAQPTETTPSSAADTLGSTEPAAPQGWTVDTSRCANPARAEQPITGTVKIGAAVPLTGGPAAAFGPVKDGFQAYLDYASQKGLLPGYTITSELRDDQYDAAQTPGVVEGLINEGVDLFSGIIGTPDNLAVRDTLNGQCIPQLLALTGSPSWSQVADFPWTTGAVVPYGIEASIYATKLNELKPGATVALYYANNEFGKAYADDFKTKAGELGLTVVDEQTIEPTVYDPPVTQLGSIAAKAPDAIIAIPLGLQCPMFLGELANAKAQTAGWAPMVFLTNTCSSKLFFGLAGAAADGVYSSNNLVDPNDPKNAAQPGVKAFLGALAAARLSDDPGITETGWNAGETTVAILNAALQTGTLSRKSIIEAARNLTFTPSLARPGVQYKMNGAADPNAFETLQVLQWSDASQTFTEIGDPITSFEH